MRWNHPELGTLTPNEFIPIAEDSRLIIELDRLTLARACREIAHHHRNGLPGLRLSVNLSPLLLERDGFVATVMTTLTKEQFPPHLLDLEITETLLMNDRPDIIDKLTQLSEAGVHIAIDDFGTGYSSLSYLQKFPIKTLKIDRSFVSNIRTSDQEACIVNAIVSMAQGLRMNIIAEGVESPAQLNYLRALGCNTVQGFLFGRPMRMEDLIKQMRGGPSVGAQFAIPFAANT